MFSLSVNFWVRFLSHNDHLYLKLIYFVCLVFNSSFLLNNLRASLLVGLAFHFLNNILMVQGRIRVGSGFNIRPNENSFPGKVYFAIFGVGLLTICFQYSLINLDLACFSDWVDSFPSSHNNLTSSVCQRESLSNYLGQNCDLLFRTFTFRVFFSFHGISLYSVQLQNLSAPLQNNKAYLCTSQLAW